jgi:hypothetical protein
MGNLGSFAFGFFTFILLTPIRSEGGGVASCARGAPCPEPVTHCYTLLGWEDVLGPLSCSTWAAAGVAVLVAVLVRAVGLRREPTNQ